MGLGPIVFAAAAVVTATGSDFTQPILDAHNKERASLGLPPVVWNAELAQGAADWAQHLAEIGRLEHSKPADRGKRFIGENLAMGTAGGYAPAAMVAGWIAEKKDFLYGTFPAVTSSPTGDWHLVGHFTQVVWRHTTEIGCAKASTALWDVLVCRYNPAGNIAGEKPY
jgi:hypothetical protein